MYPAIPYIRRLGAYLDSDRLRSPAGFCKSSRKTTLAPVRRGPGRLAKPE